MSTKNQPRHPRNEHYYALAVAYDNEGWIHVRVTESHYDPKKLTTDAILMMKAEYTGRRGALTDLALGLNELRRREGLALLVPDWDSDTPTVQLPLPLDL